MSVTTLKSAKSKRSVTELPVIEPRRQKRETCIRFDNVSKRFGEKEVLAGIDLEIEEGQFVAIIGKSGCGKSTLLRLLAGLDQPSSGTITLSSGTGEAVDTRIMFQEARLLPWARVRENVMVGAKRGLSHASARQEAMKILDEVGLYDRAGDWPYVLSGGQKQRVALARALAGHPRILALDEPLGALDALTRIEMQQLLERVWQRQKFTAVLVTHDVAEAVVLADRIVVIDSGRIALDVDVPLARPHQHGTRELAELERRILDQLFGRGR
jgi:sulfonate transport system ATP-binding protein